MDQRIVRLIDQIKAHLRETYGDRIKRVILYGSFAWGEVTKDSDVDVLVLTDPTLKRSEVTESLSELLYDMLMEEGELVSVVAIPEDFFENYNFPFTLNVKKEGVTI